MTEIEHVAAILAESFKATVAESAGMPFDETKVDLPRAEIWLRYAAVAISALDSYRFSKKRENCKHYNKLGSGSVSSDGSSKTNWYCKDCGFTYSEETPARPAEPLPLMLNALVSRSGDE